jgi:hypothetical protein
LGKDEIVLVKGEMGETWCGKIRKGKYDREGK